MKRHRHALTGRVLIYPVASALPCEGKTGLLLRSNDLPSSEARELGHQTGTSTVERLTETGSGIFLAIRTTIFDVQPDGIFDVFHGLFVGVSLAVAALKRRAGNKIAV